MIYTFMNLQKECYTNSLNYIQIQSFTKRLTRKILATYKSKKNKNTSLISINNFSKFKEAIFEEQFLDPNEKMLKMLTEIFVGIQEIIENSKQESDQSISAKRIHEISKTPDYDKKFELARAFLQYFYDKDPNIVFDYELISSTEFLSQAHEFVGEKIYQSLSELELYIYLASKYFIYG